MHLLTGITWLECQSAAAHITASNLAEPHASELVGMKSTCLFAWLPCWETYGMLCMARNTNLVGITG